MIVLVDFPRRRPAKGRSPAFVLALALLGAGPAAATPLDWDAQGAAHRVLTVAPSQAQSLCLPLKATQRVVWAFVAQSPLDFDIQFGDGSRPGAAAKRQAVSEARDLLEASQNREHCWVWRNRGGQPVQVAVQLRRR